MNRFFSLFAVPLLCMALTSNLVIAGPGHDHGDEAPLTTTGTASPRFEAHSDLFEVVGVLGGSELSIFVDRFADNAPILKAKVELESGIAKAVGQFHEEHGDYSFAAASFQKPGSYPITLTITVGDEIDVLAGNLVVPEESASHDDESSHALERAGIWALVFFVLAALIWAARWLQKRRNSGALK